MPEQAIKITCPHCGKIRSVNPAIFGTIKGPPSAALEKAYQKKRSTMTGPGKQGSGWINMKCPSCGKSYQYNPKARQARVKPS
ncbi:MAG: hypothetical protein A2Y88_03735 [Chloroflexi bacterium RBG_13_48_10]|nr:MAG: hypothetical protein A2Y88_03735 [Chloroflexi bacterium RBG_13_48_10]